MNEWFETKSVYSLKDFLMNSTWHNTFGKKEDRWLFKQLQVNQNNFFTIISPLFLCMIAWISMHPILSSGNIILANFWNQAVKFISSVGTYHVIIRLQNKQWKYYCYFSSVSISRIMV